MSTSIEGGRVFLTFGFCSFFDRLKLDLDDLVSLELEGALCLTKTYQLKGNRLDSVFGPTLRQRSLAQHHSVLDDISAWR